MGLWLSNGYDLWVIKNLQETDFEFQDNILKSTIKTLISKPDYSGEKSEGLACVVRFSDEMLKKCSDNEVSIRDQLKFS